MSSHNGHSILVAGATMASTPERGFDGFMQQGTTGTLGLCIKYNTPEDNWGVVRSYQWIYEREKLREFPFIAFIHDDVICREAGWDKRVLAEFEDPTVGIVGFGGARWHGVPELYKTPYRLDQLRRGDYLSNVDDAEVHGGRFTASAEVAVLDGFALVLRRDLLDRCNGWRGLASGCDFFCYDYAACGMARRLGYRCRVLGVRCHHLGGRTSVLLPQAEITSQEAYDRSHRWFYETYRDVMPWSVAP